MKIVQRPQAAIAEAQVALWAKFRCTTNQQVASSDEKGLT
jgi:hypothetical protein